MRQEVNIVSHEVDHKKCSRNIFPFTLMKEGIPPKIWNIIRADNYFKLYLLLYPWIKNPIIMSIINVKKTQRTHYGLENGSLGFIV